MLGRNGSAVAAHRIVDERANVVERLRLGRRDVRDNVQIAVRDVAVVQANAAGQVLA